MSVAPLVVPSMTWCVDGRVRDVSGALASRARDGDPSAQPGRSP